jgi:hypothetical protein
MRHKAEFRSRRNPHNFPLTQFAIQGILAVLDKLKFIFILYTMALVR